MDTKSDVERANEARAEMMKTAVKINLATTFSLLDELSTLQEGIIESAIPTLDGLKIEFKKIERAFEFNTGPINPVGPPVIYQNSYYGLSKPFAIRWKGKVLKVKDGTGHGIVHPGKDFSTSGLLYDLDNLSGDKPSYFRAMFPLRRTMRTPLHYALGTHFSVGESLRYYGLIQLFLSDNKFHLYNYHREEQHYLFFDGTTMMYLEEFLEILDSVLFSHGFITGSLARDERLIVQSNSATFDTVQGFLFNRLERSIDSPEDLINPKLHRDWNKLPAATYFSEALFNNLVAQSLVDKRLLRAVKLIVEGRSVPPELAAATYCVALETVKHIVVTRNEKELQPVKEEFVDVIKKALLSAVETLPGEAFNDRARLLKKISAINSIGNMDGFLLAFERMQIPLSKEEKNYLDHRNRFLHGNIPFKGEDPSDPHQFELKKVSLHIQLLCSCLILKMIGYSGPVLNFWKYWELSRGENKEPMPLFKII